MRQWILVSSLLEMQTKGVNLWVPSISLICFLHFSIHFLIDCFVAYEKTGHWIASMIGLMPGSKIQLWKLRQVNSVTCSILCVFRMWFKTNDCDILLIWSINPIHPSGFTRFVLQIRLPYLHPISSGQCFNLMCMKTRISQWGEIPLPFQNC